MKKRSLAQILVVTLVVTMFLLAGCNNAELDKPKPTPANPTPADNAELIIARWAGPHADDQKEVVKEYPDANIVIDDVEYGGLKQKEILSTQTAAGTKGNYDAIWVNSQWMKEYVDAGYIMPLDDYIKDNNLDTSIYSKGLMENCTFDDKIYGLPTFAQSIIIAYDSDVFNKEGIKVPENTEELINVAKYFKEKGTGIAMQGKQAGAAFTLWSQIFFSSGGYYYNEDNEFDLTSEESVYAATVYDELIKYSVNGSLSWEHDEVAEAVRTGIAPIGFIMSGLANQNHDPEKSKIVDTVEYTTLNGKDGDTSANTAFWVWTIPKNAKDPEASYKFIQWLTSPEIEKIQTLKNQQISAIDALSSDPEVVEKTPFLPVVMKELAGGKMDPALVNFQQIKDAIAKGLSELATSDAKPADVMQEVQDSIKDLDLTR